MSFENLSVRRGSEQCVFPHEGIKKSSLNKVLKLKASAELGKQGGRMCHEDTKMGSDGLSDAQGELSVLQKQAKSIFLISQETTLK